MGNLATREEETPEISSQPDSEVMNPEDTQKDKKIKVFQHIPGVPMNEYEELQSKEDKFSYNLIYLQAYPEISIPRLHELAKDNFEHAQLILGECYRLGDHVNKDINLSISLFEEILNNSTNQIFVQKAARNLNIIYRSNEDYEQVVRVSQKLREINERLA